MLHLLTIEEIKHIDIDGTVLWEEKNIDNILHLNAELFLLSLAFNTSGGISVPTNYYIGMDNRTTLAFGDTFNNLSSEPTQNGYLRQAVSSATGFNVSVSSDGNYRAVSSTLTFSASGGSWGPVRNVFLGTTATNAGYLLSSIALDDPRTVLDGQSVTLRFSLGLKNC